MPEHTIPESLIDQIRSGRAVLVVGSGVGVPSWKQLLERMTKELETRGADGDDAAAKDLAKLLHKGSLVRAVGFLGRALGDESCFDLVQDMWRTPPELPEMAKVMATLPFRHVWTTFPGDMLERALADHSPETWAPSRTVAYHDLGELSARRRTLVKILGNFENYVVTPRSVRRALSRAMDLRDYVREHYVAGTLVFVGFRFGDPDLAALLDRVFGVFEPPQGTHYFVGAGVGPVTVDELMADHRIEVVNLDGKGADEVAERSVLDWLLALRDACNGAGLTLAQSRPDADDLEGWLALYGDDAEARDAVDLIERRARDAGDHERTIEVLLGKIEHTEEGVRAQLLRDVAKVYETGTGDLKHAFEALAAACQLDPSDDEAIADLERLAAANGAWSDLVAEASSIATEVRDPIVASKWWGRMGVWYGQRLDRADYAAPSLRRALELDARNLAAHGALSELLRRQSKWAELADALRAHIEIEPDGAAKVDLLLALGDLAETQLASTAKAIEAYQAALDLDDANTDALGALERLYRRDEKWSHLAKVLERSAEISATAGDSGRAAAIRRELATLRADKLGDLEGAIAKYEAAIHADAADVAALKALEDLYEKTGRTDDYHRTLERLAEVAPEGERLAKLRKLAAELEDREGQGDRAMAAYQRIIEIDSGADDAYRGWARMLRAASKHYDLVTLLERHIAAAKQPAQRVELLLQAAEVCEKDLADPHRAIEHHLNALAIDDGCKPALTALARLYQRTEVFARAADCLVKLAQLEPGRGAAAWAEAGAIALEQLLDPEVAERYLEAALSIDAEHLSALRTLAELHQRRSSWANAIEFLLRAEQASANRLERVELLWRAAQLAEDKIDDHNRALDLYERVLRLDPDNVEAGEKVADRLVAAGRWDDAVPVLEMLARRAEGADRLERARRETQLGRAYHELHRPEKAARHYRLAVEADPDSLEAALGLAEVLMLEAGTLEGQEAAAERWNEVDRRYRDILARHRVGLADSQVVDLWYRLGIAARALGDDRRADNAFRRALEREPQHPETLAALVDLATVRSDWKTVIEVKRTQIEAANEAGKLRLLDEIGDIHAGKLGDPGTAVGAYLEALSLAPGHRSILHKLLDAYTEQKLWRRAVETLEQLAEQESSIERRARYYYTAAVIARDELGDADLAMERFNQALDDAPATPKAFEALDRMLTDKKDWKNLVRAYRKMLKRLGEEAEPAQLLPLWTRLGDICLEHLGDHQAAIAAYEVAADLAPDELPRHEQLAELYLEAGEPRRADAIEELQLLLSHNPDRVELYKALANLYRGEHELDKAWCLSQALVFLGAATAQERALFEKHRPRDYKPANRRLTEELWQKAIIHPKEDRHVGAIFASTLGALAGASAQPPTGFGLDVAKRADLDRDPRPITRVLKHAANVLTLDPVPMVWIDEAGDALRVANTTGLGTDKGRLVPTLLVGAPQLARSDEREVMFEVGKRMAYLRPERFVNFAMSTLPKIESAFAAALVAAGVSYEAGEEAKSLGASLKGAIPDAMLEHVRALSTKIAHRFGNGLVTSWRSAADLTGNRVGLILCGDLEVAARMVATEAAALSSLGPKDRLRDLLAYSVSEGYFQVRRHLGVHVRDEASA